MHLPSEEETSLLVLVNSTLKMAQNRPESGVDWLICSLFARKVRPFTNQSDLLGAAAERGRDWFNDCKYFHPEHGSSQGRNLALTGLVVPFALNRSRTRATRLLGASAERDSSQGTRMLASARCDLQASAALSHCSTAQSLTSARQILYEKMIELKRFGS